MCTCRSWNRYGPKVQSGVNHHTWLYNHQLIKLKQGQSNSLEISSEISITFHQIVTYYRARQRPRRCHTDVFYRCHIEESLWSWHKALSPGYSKPSSIRAVVCTDEQLLWASCRCCMLYMACQSTHKIVMHYLQRGLESKRHWGAQSCRQTKTSILDNSAQPWIMLSAKVLYNWSQSYFL